MLRGLFELTWLETKIFVREPLGVIGTVAVPIVMYVAAGRMLGGPSARASSQVRGFLSVGPNTNTEAAYRNEQPPRRFRCLGGNLVWAASASLTCLP